MKLERFITLIRGDLRRPWDPWTIILLIASLSMLTIERLRLCKPPHPHGWSAPCFWGSFPLAAIFVGTALTLFRREGAKVLPALALLLLIGFGREQVEMAVAWLLLVLMWLLYILIGFIAHIMGR
jgi:hypothetical protein